MEKDAKNIKKALPDNNKVIKLLLSKVNGLEREAVQHVVQVVHDSIVDVLRDDTIIDMNKILDIVGKYFATKEDLANLRIELAKFATKEDLEKLRKDLMQELSKFATKEDLQRFATKEDLQRFATKEDLQRFATKEDLSKTEAILKAEMKADKAEVKAEIAGLKTELIRVIIGSVFTAMSIAVALIKILPNKML